MTYEQIDDTVNNVNSNLVDMITTQQNNVASVVSQVDDYYNTVKIEEDLRVKLIQIQIGNYILTKEVNAQYHYLKAAIDPDPGFIAIILGVVKIVNAVINAVKFVLNSKIFQVLIAIHKILSSVWPEYRKAVLDVMGKVSDLSKQIGMGADGLAHLMNAASAGVGIINGLFGKDIGILQQDAFTRYATTLNHISSFAKNIENDPAGMIEWIARLGQEQEQSEVSRWWDGVSKFINDGINEVADNVAQVATVTTELQKAVDSMPQFVIDNIPSWIPDGLYDINSMINEDINPAIIQLRQTTISITNTIQQFQVNIRGLQNGLLNPGVTLLRVDDLDAVEKQRQLGMIDDVTSRDFVTGNAATTAAMTDTYSALDTIVNGLKAPTPQPPEFNLENIPGHELPGIKVEPHETWMVGGYSSPY